ncbi:hypothetical protein [Rhizobium sp. BK376]|uniref:hypothetical protein n=1 Tax=Rhizobium sp. BK376 TaxID=2512149 RepID=UPI001044D4E7|nr:hypothetical protein [Rhizobium sp. BK376]TCR76755.1 hypothetical protein EV561_11915 [Rhizobium sp. BK376]
MKNFDAFISGTKELARQKQVVWSTPTDASGDIALAYRWAMGAMAGARRQEPYFSSSSPDESALHHLNSVRAARGLPAVQRKAAGSDWCDLMKAVIIEQIYIRTNGPGQAHRHVLMLRLLAADAEDTPPWDLDPGTVRRSYNAALTKGLSGKDALDFKTTIRLYFDRRDLADLPALERHCVAFAGIGSEVMELRRLSQNNHHSRLAILSRLGDRRSAEKLPDRDSYARIVDIVFMMQPQNFSDRIRFCAIKKMIILGLRSEEVLGAPADCLAWRDYFDADGTAAGTKGGVSREHAFRFFAAKQPTQEESTDGKVLFETSQSVPQRFQGGCRGYGGGNARADGSGPQTHPAPISHGTAASGVLRN